MPRTWTATEVNKQDRELMSEGYGTIVVKNPGAMHGLGVGILNRLQLYFEGLARLLRAAA